MRCRTVAGEDATPFQWAAAAADMVDDVADTERLMLPDAAPLFCCGMPDSADDMLGLRVPSLTLLWLGAR